MFCKKNYRLLVKAASVVFNISLKSILHPLHLHFNIFLFLVTNYQRVGCSGQNHSEISIELKNIL